MKAPNLIRRYLAAGLLITVASVHIYQHRTMDRSAWGTGCGFGMFSTVDYHGTRHLKCLVMTDDGEKKLSVPKDLSLRARALPTIANLKVLANQLLSLAEHRWPSTSSVQLELWCTNFDAQSRTLSVRKYRQATAGDPSRIGATPDTNPIFVDLAMQTVGPELTEGATP